MSICTKCMQNNNSGARVCAHCTRAMDSGNDAIGFLMLVLFLGIGFTAHIYTDYVKPFVEQHILK